MLDDARAACVAADPPAVHLAIHIGAFVNNPAAIAALPEAVPPCNTTFRQLPGDCRSCAINSRTYRDFPGCD